MKVKSFSRVPLVATPWTAAYQAPPSMGFSRQEYWSGLPLPSPSKILVLRIQRQSETTLFLISWKEIGDVPALMEKERER